MPFNVPQIGIRKVRFVGGYLGHRETLGGRVQQPRQHGRIMDVGWRDLNRRDDVRPGSAHNVGLEPLAVGLLFAPLSIKPAVKAAGAKAGAIHGEGGLHNVKGLGTSLDKVSDDWPQVRVGDVAINHIEGGLHANKALSVGVSDI